MVAHGFQPEFPPEVARQLDALAAAPPDAAPQPGVQDLRALPWTSIDNDTSRDLDQIEIAERLPDGGARVRVGLADVGAFVAKGTAIDDYAAIETTSVYAGVRVFPMLPDALSTAASSLLPGADRLAIVVSFVVDEAGLVHDGAVSRAVVRNHAQLAYPSVGTWLAREGPAPPGVAAASELQAQLRLQDEVAGWLETARVHRGALNIETIQTRPVLRDGEVVDVARQERNRATSLIENFMIAANEVVARRLEAGGASSIRRVVRTPARWDRIVALAATQGGRLPAAPDSKALNAFLLERRAADPDRFADLSLSVIKLLGPGEYVLERPGQPGPGHFGLAVDDYTHSTAPNRRFADLVTERLIKALLASQPAPYSDDELAAVARACTIKEDAARKVEREMTKRISAVAMSHRIGETFDAIVTGVTAHGSFVRVLRPHVEGLLENPRGLDVGDRVHVRLVRT